MNASFKEIRGRFADLDTRYRALSLRERALVGALLIAATFFGVDQFLLRPVMEERRGVVHRVRQARTDVNTLELELANLGRFGQSVEQRQRAERTERLERQLAEIERRLETTVAAMVPPEAMVGILESLLADAPGLELASLQSLPPARLDSSAAEGDVTSEAAPRGESPLYRHGLVLELRGGFHAALDYLARVEASGWNLLWERLEYRVESHPTARVTIELQTISDREEWIGV